MKKQEETFIITDKHGSDMKDQRRQGRSKLESELRVRIFKNPEMLLPQAGLTGTSSTHKKEQVLAPHLVKLSEQDASPAGNVDNHSLELHLCVF